eukprot:1057237-Pleurochrysis_carterae.AAC.1
MGGMGVGSHLFHDGSNLRNRGHAFELEAQQKHVRPATHARDPGVPLFDHTPGRLHQGAHVCASLAQC